MMEENSLERRVEGSIELYNDRNNEKYGVKDYIKDIAISFIPGGLMYPEVKDNSLSVTIKALAWSCDFLMGALTYGPILLFLQNPSNINHLVVSANLIMLRMMLSVKYRKIDKREKEDNLKIKQSTNPIGDYQPGNLSLTPSAEEGALSITHEQGALSLKEENTLDD